MGRTSYTSNMFSLKLVLCVCFFFVIGMEGAPKPKPKAEPKPQPKAEPKPFPPFRYPPYIPGANPGPGNWNGFPPTRGDYPWQRNGSPLYYGNRGNRKTECWELENPRACNKEKCCSWYVNKGWTRNETGCWRIC